MGHIARKVGIVMLTLIGLIEGKIRNDEQRVTCIKYLSEWIAEHVNDRRKMKKKKKFFSHHQWKENIVPRLTFYNIYDIF